MFLSEMIEQLQEYYDTYGDMEVNAEEDEYNCDRYWNIRLCVESFRPSANKTTRNLRILFS